MSIISVCIDLLSELVFLIVFFAVSFVQKPFWDFIVLETGFWQLGIKRFSDFRSQVKLNLFDLLFGKVLFVLLQVEFPVGLFDDWVNVIDAVFLIGRNPFL